MTVRACFTGLGYGLEVDLIDGSNSTVSFELHSAAIRSHFAAQPDLPLDQDSVGGFLYGLQLVRHSLVRWGSAEQRSIVPALRGAFLLGRSLPAGPLRPGAADRSMARIAAGLEGWHGEVEPAQSVVRRMFEVFGDVPMTRPSLTGFCLGASYAGPYARPSGSDVMQLVAAGHRLAAELE
jgi:hypothetical protein